MKKILFSAFLLVSLQYSFVSLNSSEEVKIYGITLKAQDITGQKKFISTSQQYHTSLLSPLVEKRDNEFLYGLGSYRKNLNRTETLDLFNCSFYEKPLPFLDTIDFHYYQSHGFDLVASRNPQMEANPLFNELKDTLKKTKLLSAKKEILFMGKYKSIRNELILSRYDVIAKPFKIGKKKITTSTAELKAQLDTIMVKNNLEASANIRAYLYGLADEDLQLMGTYYDARMNDSYINMINYYIANTSRISLNNDIFAFNLKNYLGEKDAAINSGLVAIQISGKYDRTKINKDSISVALQSKFNIPAEKAIKISASVNYSFTKNETINLNTQFSSVFILRYFTSEVLDEVRFPNIRTVQFHF